MSRFIPADHIGLERGVLQVAEWSNAEIWHGIPNEEVQLWNRLGRSMYAQGLEFKIDQFSGAERKGFFERYLSYLSAEDEVRKALHAGYLTAYVLAEGHSVTVDREFWGTEAGILPFGDGMINIAGAVWPDRVLNLGIVRTIVFMREADLAKRFVKTAASSKEILDDSAANAAVKTPISTELTRREAATDQPVSGSEINTRVGSTRLGRKPTYDWPDVQEFVRKTLEHHGLPSADDPDLPDQAALERRIMQHCLQRYGREPAISNVRPKLAKWLKEFKETQVRN
ncbi:hypothetical protein J2X36_004609 [Methylobacterium sp. BE186]|uniref:hypothetical protein n=1 Tax=Methylobacterium sp. BE186 TaxID=2817715 RepID=UPI0028657200|nr:hypothetical protein [Methylobacterium sp. BE186]MDR7039831.1 hypothetical protein [Methylobacterium sp. BE186]